MVKKGLTETDLDKLQEKKIDRTLGFYAFLIAIGIGICSSVMIESGFQLYFLNTQYNYINSTYTQEIIQSASNYDKWDITTRLSQIQNEYNIYGISFLLSFYFCFIFVLLYYSYISTVNGYDFIYNFKDKITDEDSNRIFELIKSHFNKLSIRKINNFIYLFHIFKLSTITIRIEDNKMILKIQDNPKDLSNSLIIEKILDKNFNEKRSLFKLKTIYANQRFSRGVFPNIWLYFQLLLILLSYILIITLLLFLFP